MICYRDRTFCPFYTSCTNGSDCPSALTDIMIQSAHEWWEWFMKNKDVNINEVPICQYTEEPKCYIEKGDLK